MVNVRTHIRKINGKKVNVRNHTRKKTTSSYRPSYPLQSSKKEIEISVSMGENKIKSELNMRQYKKLKEIERKSNKGKGTHTKYSRNGKFFKSREKLHNSVLKKTFRDSRTIDIEDPDLYLLGGVAGSGKSTALSPKIPEEIVVVDADAFKKELAKKDKSPIKGKPLAHAGLLHEESSYLIEESLKKAKKEKRDIGLDATLANKKKAVKLIQDFKKEGYDIHLLGTQIKPHTSINRAVDRFIKGKDGRYVPPKIIASKGNKINKNVISLRKYADTYEIRDTSTRPSKLVSKKGNIKDNFR